MFKQKVSLTGISLPEGSLQHFAQRSSSSLSVYSAHNDPPADPPKWALFNKRKTTPQRSVSFKKSNAFRRKYKQESLLTSSESSFSNRPVELQVATAAATAAAMNAINQKHTLNPKGAQSMESLAKINYVTRLHRAPAMRLAPIKRFFVRLFRIRSRRRWIVFKKKGSTKLKGRISGPVKVKRYDGSGLGVSAGDDMSMYYPRYSKSRTPSLPRDTISGSANSLSSYGYENMNQLRVRPHSASSRISDVYDRQLDSRLSQIQSEIVGSVRVKRRSSRLSSLSRMSSFSRQSSVSSFYYRARYSGEFTRRQSLRTAGHMISVPSLRKIQMMDKESESSIEDALAFVNAWKVYLRQSISHKVALRKQENSLLQYETFLDSVEEESNFDEMDTSSEMSIPISVDKELYVTRNGSTVSITPLPSRSSSSLKTRHNQYESSKVKRTVSYVRKALHQDRMAKKYSTLISTNEIQKSPLENHTAAATSTTLSVSSPVNISADNEELHDTRPESRESLQSISEESDISFSKPGHESLWMRSSSSSGTTTLGATPRPLPPTPRELTSKDSGRVRESRSRLLQQQRKMSEMVLQDMVSELEEMQARVSAYKTQNTTSNDRGSSGSEYSVLKQPTGIVGLKGNYVLLGSKNSDSSLSSSGSRVSPNVKWEEIPRDKEQVYLSRGGKNRRRSRDSLFNTLSASTAVNNV